MSVTMWQTTNLDYAVAEELFGWRWMTCKGIPVRGTPDYPKECRVRRFYPPETLANKQWQEYFAEQGGIEPSTGKEPLDYSYCSSQGPACVPHFSGDHNAIAQMERELRKQKVQWGRYISILGKRRSCKAKCIAALAAVGSKYVARTEGNE
jgi:hypothetical protein